MGRKFKLEVWEELVKTMRVGEVASFTVNKEVSNKIGHRLKSPLLPVGSAVLKTKSKLCIFAIFYFFVDS